MKLAGSITGGTGARRWASLDTEGGNPAVTFLVVSMLLHVLVLFIATNKMKFFDEPENMEDVITIEMLDLPDVPITEKTVIPEKVTPPPIKPKDDVKPAEKVTSKTPPKVEEKPQPAPKAQETVKPAEPEKAPDEPAPAPDTVDEAAVKDQAPSPEATQSPPPVPVRRPRVMTDTEKPAEPKEAEAASKMSFQSVLKNLAGSDQAAPQDELKDQAPENADNRQAPVLTQPPPVSEQMSMSESQALQRQLAACWSVMPGARDAEGLYVDVYMVMNPDRTVQQARIVDQGRYNADSYFRAAADSALRALRHPNCTPLLLPPYKYDQWKTMTVRFDPKYML